MSAPPNVEDAATQAALAMNLSFTVRLRFGATLGQVVTILFTRYGLGVPLPLLPLFLVIAPALLANLYCASRLAGGRMTSGQAWLLPALLALDVLVLTGLLSLTGGPFNPFSFLYLVQIAMAAVVLPERWTWALMLLAVVCSGSLFYHHRPLPMNVHGDHMQAHLRGMWVAFSIAACFIVYFLLRVTRALSLREAELRESNQRAANREHLAALATLAAGAAHELATPLSTIALVARELTRHLQPAAGTTLTTDAQEAARADAALIRQEVERCRAVLTQLSTDAGQSPGEALEPLSAEALLEEVARSAPAGAAVRVVDHTRGALLRLPRRALVRALRGLVKNSGDAGAAHVELRAQRVEDSLCIEVRDDGPGLSDEVLRRAGEPFFTTKEPGRGLGLGLFLCRALCGSLGGDLSLLRPPSGGGALVRLRLPWTAAPREVSP